ncbi:MAG TPA: hypothetical protein VEF55_05285 [Candidatus Binatia bacterium]|nr:hypothetical protein [Candidatus Binatia bacterium]
MRGAFRTLLFAACALAAVSAPAYASTDGWGDDIEVMDDAEMNDLRGGFNVGGIEIGFGAVVTSTLNGVPVMTTQLTVTDAGSIVEQTMNTAGQTLGSLTTEQLAALGLAAFAGMEGVVIDGEGGITAFVHNITDGTVQNILVNTANGQDIEQDVDITLTLPGFEAIQSEFAMARFGMQISDDLHAVAIGLHD